MNIIFFHYIKINNLAINCALQSQCWRWSFEHLLPDLGDNPYNEAFSRFFIFSIIFSHFWDVCGLIECFSCVYCFFTTVSCFSYCIARVVFSKKLFKFQALFSLCCLGEDNTVSSWGYLQFLIVAGALDYLSPQARLWCVGRRPPCL